MKRKYTMSQRTTEDKKKDLEDISNKLDQLQASLLNNISTQNEIHNEIHSKRNYIRRASIIQDEIDRLKLVIADSAKSISIMTSIQLDELTKYNNPPKRVKLVLEAVMYLLTERKLEWEQIRTEMYARDFIQTVLKFDSLTISPNVIENIRDNYIDNKNWDIEKIRNASQACGPLAEWLQNQVSLLNALKQMANAQREIKILTTEMRALELQDIDLTTEIQSIRKTISNFEIKKIQITKEIENPEIIFNDEEHPNFDGLEFDQLIITSALQNNANNGEEKSQKNSTK